MDYHKLQCIDASVFCASFKRGLNRFLFELLRHDDIKEKCIEWASIFRKKKGKNPLLMENFDSNEDVVIRVLEVFKDDISGTIDFILPETEENILHLFLRKGMQRAVLFLIRKYDVGNLAFVPNRNGEIPLHLAINHGGYDEKESATNKIFKIKYGYRCDIATAIWQYMMSFEDKEKLEIAITRLNLKNENILHACSDSRMHTLFSKICLDSDLDKKVVQKAVDQGNVIKKNSIRFMHGRRNGVENRK